MKRLQQEVRTHSEPVHWRLVYAGDRLLEEPLEGGSILLAYAEARELQVLYRDGTIIHRVNLCDEKGRPAYRPIWYRERSQSVNFSLKTGRIDLGGGFGEVASRKRATSRLDATVYGRGRVNTSSCDLTLWALIGTKIDNCPESLFRQDVIERLLTEPLSKKLIIV